MHAKDVLFCCYRLAQLLIRRQICGRDQCITEKDESLSLVNCPEKLDGAKQSLGIPIVSYFARVLASVMWSGSARLLIVDAELRHWGQISEYK